MFGHVRIALAALITLSCATAWTRAGDKEDIRDSVIALSKALSEGDAATARKHVLKDENTDKIVDGLALMTKATKGLQEAAVAKFGEAGKTIAGQGMMQHAARIEDFKDFDDARLSINGDTATIAPKDGRGKPTTFKKVDGIWKLDLALMSNSANAAQGAAAMPKMAGVMDSLAAEIKAGQYSSVQEARQAYYQKLAAAFGGSRPGARP